MPWSIKLEKEAQKNLAKLTYEYQALIFESLPLIAEDPYRGKKLKGELSGLYSWRAWPYRIIYRIYRHEILVVVVKIAHRQGVYRK
jgi:mRNA interferase RelE/StbE